MDAVEPMGIDADGKGETEGNCRVEVEDIGGQELVVLSATKDLKEGDVLIQQLDLDELSPADVLLNYGRCLPEEFISTMEVLLCLDVQPSTQKTHLKFESLMTIWSLEWSKIYAYFSAKSAQLDFSGQGLHWKCLTKAAAVAGCSSREASWWLAFAGELTTLGKIWGRRWDQTGWFEGGSHQTPSCFALKVFFGKISWTQKQGRCNTKGFGGGC